MLLTLVWPRLSYSSFTLRITNEWLVICGFGQESALQVACLFS